MYINVVAILLIFAASEMISEGVYCLVKYKESTNETIMDCVKILLGGLLLGVVYFAL